MLTWAQFVEKVKTFLTVDANRIGTEAYVSELIRLGAVEVQEFIDYYRKGHEAVWEVDDVDRDGFASLVDLPEGAYIRELYHTKLGEPSLERPLYWYPNSNRRDLVAGAVNIRRNFRFTTDPQAKRMWVLPAITAGYAIKLTYDGAKDNFADSDKVPFDLKVALVVSHYVLWHLNRKLDQLALAESYGRDYRRSLSQLFVDARERLMENTVPSQADCIPGNGCVSGSLCLPCSGASPDGTCTNPTEFPSLEWVMFGDSGDITTQAETTELSAAVRALNPGLIVHLGDANYPVGSSITLGDNFVRHFWSWINSGDLFVAYGDRDLTTSYGDPLTGILLAQQAAIGASKIADHKLWYQFARGNVEFFVLNSGLDDDDDLATSGANYAEQYAWLESAMAASTATWKVVVCHRAPYTSDAVNTPGSSVMRWPFKQWGADVVVSAHGKDYERLLVDGMNYVVCGTGGAGKTRATAPRLTESQFYWADGIGYLRCSADAERLTLSFVNARTCQVVDRLVLVSSAASGIPEPTGYVATPTFLVEPVTPTGFTIYTAMTWRAEFLTDPTFPEWTATYPGQTTINGTWALGNSSSSVENPSGNQYRGIAWPVAQGFPRAGDGFSGATMGTGWTSPVVINGWTGAIITLGGVPHYAFRTTLLGPGPASLTVAT